MNQRADEEEAGIVADDGEVVAHKVTKKKKQKQEIKCGKEVICVETA